MGSFQSFAELLEQKIRREIEKEYSQDSKASEAQRPQTQSETWVHLIGKVDTVHFKETKKGETYHRFRPAPKPRPAHILNPDQQQALAFFQSQITLAANFTRAELQKAFRVLALRFHPDQGGQSAHFQSLVRARKQLETVFN